MYSCFIDPRVVLSLQTKRLGQMDAIPALYTEGPTLNPRRPALLISFSFIFLGTFIQIPG
jgi:hypothetical protein